MGTGELVDAASLEWEAELRDLLLEKRLISFRSCFFPRGPHSKLETRLIKLCGF